MTEESLKSLCETYYSRLVKQRRVYRRKFPRPPLSEISGSAPERGVDLSMLELQDACEGNRPGITAIVPWEQKGYA